MREQLKEALAAHASCAEYAYFNRFSCLHADGFGDSLRGGILAKPERRRAISVSPLGAIILAARGAQRNFQSRSGRWTAEQLQIMFRAEAGKVSL